MADHTTPSLTTGSSVFDYHSTTRHSARECSESVVSDYCVPGQMGKSIAECCGETTSPHHNNRRNLPQAQELVVVKATTFPTQGTANSSSSNSTILSSPPPLRQTKFNHHVTSSISSRDAQLRSYENEPDYHAVKLAADCLHAQDYARMIAVLANQRTTTAVLFGQALAYYKLRKFPEATQSLSKLDELASTEPSESSNLYLAHYYLGEIHIAHGRYRQAAKHYRKASMAYTTDTVAKRYRIVQPTRAAIFSKRGSALRHSQQIMEAVRVYREALGEAESKKDRLAVYTSLGNLYQSLGENTTALTQYEHTVTLAEDLRDYVSQGWAYGNMGNAYLGLNQKDKALKNLEKSLELTIKHEPSPQAIGRAYNNLGTAYQSLSELKKAEEYYDLALSQAIYGMDIGGQARVYGNYGNLLMIQKKYEQAIVHYSESLSITTDRSTRSTAHHNRGCAYYEKAETGKKKLIKASGDARTPFYITYDGPSVTDQPHALSLDNSLKKDYRDGRGDLTEVVAYHEETFQTIKGSSQGLSLSVSLFETNSRTFHRLQDCLVNLGEWTGALECAEQSRARTLGELMLQRKEGQLEMELSSPLKIDQVERIIESVDTTVVFLSYTGARLLAWVFTPCHHHHHGNNKVIINRFEVALEDDQFDGKSLDYFLRYTLSEKLIDDSVEMYSTSPSYADSPPLTKLFQAFGEPLLTILDQLDHDNNNNRTTVRDVIVIPDSYTNFTPLVALLNTAASGGKFLGDRLCFRIMPSLLTLGILSQLPEVIVRVPEESGDFCIVGNPTIPTFKYQGDTWNLGKLPFATQEAEGVAHILKSSATLHEQATKMVIQSMISGAKVIHLATHGSASAGFLAFAGLGSSRSKAVSDEKLVLLYPEEVEKLNISPALVVLSSCDSGRGAVKADGIQGMARAFILAGAQAVLTTLWRVPDESAAVFMQFFYQYMMDGLKGSHALRKAILSIRSFQKYSRYIHWSGFQLTGREVQFVVAEDRVGEELQRKMGPQTVYPRLEQVKALEKAFLKNPCLPTDVQIIVGVHGLKPSEVAVELVSHHHQHFTGGVFFISAENEHFMMAAEQRIKKELKDTSDEPTLVILDNLESLPPTTSSLHTLLNRNSTHIIIILYSPSALHTLRKQVDTKLMRGVNVMELKPLSELHSTQRLVHSVLSRCDFTPYNKEQRMLADIAEKTMGSPDLVELTAALLSKYIEEEEEEEGEGEGEGGFLEKFYNRMTSSEEADFAVHLVKDFNLSRSDFFLVSTLSLFGAVPIPRCLVEEIQLLAVSASPHLPSKHSPLAYLTANHLLNVYPSTTLHSPASHTATTTTTTQTRPSHLNSPALTESDFYYVPEVICDAVKCCMDDRDLLFSFAAAQRSLNRFYSSGHLKDVLDKGLAPFMSGLAMVLANTMASHVQLQEHVSKGMEECYKAVYRTYLLYSITDHNKQQLN